MTEESFFDVGRLHVLASAEDRDRKRTERINAAIQRFRTALRLEEWDIRYDPRWRKRDKKQHAYAYLAPDPEWRIAKIHIDPDVSGDNLDQVVAHEVAHLLAWNLHKMLGETAAKTGPGGQAIIDLMDVEVELLCNRVAFALTGVHFAPRIPLDHEEWGAWAPAA